MENQNPRVPILWEHSLKNLLGHDYGRDGDVTYALPARSNPTRFYQRAPYLYINVTHISNSEEPSRVHFAI